jgi:hypothetical protein
VGVHAKKNGHSKVAVSKSLGDIVGKLEIFEPSLALQICYAIPLSQDVTAIEAILQPIHLCEHPQYGGYEGHFYNNFG